MSQQALIVIDLQNDYFADGKFPQWEADATLARTEAAIALAHARNVPVILVQHIADASKGIAPFFNEGTPGVALHPRLLSAAPEAPVVIKRFADSFHQTTLADELARRGVEEILLCGMMTQNCVTHTALSKAAGKYTVKVLTDCCTSVSKMIHLIALNALSIRVGLLEAKAALDG